MTADQQNHEPEHTWRAIDEILRRVDCLPVLDTRSADEIFDYDENELPESHHRN